MYPTEKSGYVTAKSLKSAINRFDDDASSGKSEDNVSRPQLQQSSILQDLVHTALKTRKDLEDTPGHSAGWGGIDQEHVDMVMFPYQRYGANLYHLVPTKPTLLNSLVPT